MEPQLHDQLWNAYLRVMRGYGLMSRSRFLRQAVKVDPMMRRTDHHEDAQTFYG